MKLTLNKKTILIIFLFWLLSTLIRSYGVRNYNFPYWFDLGRDAIVSREIIENKDIKIQGPSASGTDDTIYHGVMFYYLIGPLYTLFQGDPQYVMYAVIAFSSLGIIPFYLLTLSITKKEKIANIAAILYIFSHEMFKGATWLSNPVIATVSLPFFFYFFWQIFFEKNRKLLPWLLLSLAVTHQAGILYAPWWLLIFIGFFIEYKENTIKKWKLSTIIYSAIAYTLGVSTMILTQLKLMAAGIFTLESLSNFSAKEYIGSKVAVSMLTGQYYTKILKSLYPSLPIISVLAFIGLIYYANKHFTNKVKTFFAILGASPLLLLSWHYRTAYHSFLTLELVLLIILATLIYNLLQNKAGKIIGILLFVVYISSNISGFKHDTEIRFGEYFVPQGAYLSELLEAVDYTYQEADGAEFSISTITNPYRYNSLWSYLYSWYGQKKYGYLPYWYGNDQTGMFGGDILTKTETAKAIHFSIREPGQGMPTHIFAWFEFDQNAVATPSATTFFGSLDVRKHESSL